MANKISSQFKAIVKSKTFSEMLENIPWVYIEFLAFFPLLLFVLTPLLQLIHVFIDPYAHSVAYATKTSAAFICAATLGMTGVLLYILKHVHTYGKPSLKSVIKQNIPMVFFCFLILMIIISTLINGFTDKALYGDIYRQESFFEFIGYFAVYFLSATIVSDKRLKAVLLYTLISASIPVAIVTILDSRFFNIPALNQCSGASGVFHQFNHYAYYLIIVILISSVLFVKEKKPWARVLCMAAFLINNVMLVINDTFGCYLACFIALVFAAVFISITEKKFNIMSVVMVVIFIAISGIMSIWEQAISSNIFTFAGDIGNVIEDPGNADKAGTGRWTLWTHTMGYITEKPIFGFGVEGINERLALETHNVNDRPHNEFLEYAVFFGIPAAVAYICGVFSVYLSGLKNRAKLDLYEIAALAAAFAYLVSSVFGNTMYYTAPFLFIMLGLGSHLEVRG